MADEPTFPETVESDSDDVSWALETGRSMWAQGDHKEGLKWLKRAAESASEEEDDMRSLELAKAAADLRNFVEEENGPLSAFPPPVAESSSSAQEEAPSPSSQGSERATPSSSEGPPPVDSIAPLGAPLEEDGDESPIDEPTTEFTAEKMAAARAEMAQQAQAKAQPQKADKSPPRKRSLPTPKKKAPPAPTPSRPAPPAPTPSRPAPPAPTPSRPAPPPRPSQPAPSSGAPSSAPPSEMRADDDNRPTMIQPVRAVTGTPPPVQAASAHHDALRVAIAPDPGAINAWMARPLPPGEEPRAGERLAMLIALDGQSLGT